MQKSLGKDAINLTVSKVITMVIAMISAMLLSRFRTLEEYGTYSQLLLVIQLAISIFTLGLPYSINFFLAKANSLEEKRTFLSTYYIFNTILCVITGMILYFITPFIINYFNNSLIQNFMYVLAILPWANVIAASIENVLVVYQKTVNLMIFRALNSLSLLLIIFVAIVLKMSFNAYMMMYVIVQSLFAIIVYLIVKNLVNHFEFSFNKFLVHKILKFSIPLGLATMVGTISIELDKMIIGAYFSTDQLAIYTNASKEMPVTIIAASLTAVLMPQLVRLLKDNKKEEAIKLWGETTVLSYVFICFFATVLFVFAPQIITVLYSEKYLPGTDIFRVYSIFLLFRVTYFGMILNSIGKTKFVFYSSLASLVLNVIFNFMFLYLFGIVGPAFATLFSTSVVALAQLIYSGKVLSISLKNIFPWKALRNITIVNLVMGIAIYFLFVNFFNYQKNSTLSVLSLGIVWTVVYCLIFYGYGKKKWKEINSK